MKNNTPKELTFPRDSYGFTLIEMLLVVGIIAVLTAVSIPMISNSLENTKIHTDEANERAAKGAAMTEYLSNGTFGNSAGGVKTTAYFDAAAGQWKSTNTGIAPYGKCETEEHTDLVLGGELSSADGSLLLFWIPSGKTDEFLRIPTHSGLTVEKPTHPLAPEGELATNWDYRLDEANNIVTLNYYKGNETDVIVYGSYPIGGKTYKTRLKSNEASAKNQNISYMFNGAGIGRNNCQKIKTITFSNTIDASNVTNMDYMFAFCKSIQSLDLSNFNTSKVTSMDFMFDGCTSLTTLDLSNFNTSNVTNMHRMFENCGSLTTLDLSDFDTSKVKDTSSMFNFCSNLTTLKTTQGKWVKNPGCNKLGMFNGCTLLSNDQKGAFYP